MRSGEIMFIWDSCDVVVVDVRREVEEIVGGRWVVDGEDAALFGFDAFTAVKGRPRLVALPADEEQTVRLMALLYRTGTPIIFRGSGTSLSGSTVALTGDEVVVSLTRLNRVYRCEGLEIEVGPGLANVLVTRHAPHDLFYAPDPSSYTVCSIGGNVSHDSGGIHVPKYGSTFNSVVKLRVALCDGSVEDVGGTPYFNGANIFVGSEGGLGAVLRATLRLHPRPETTRTVLGAFQDVASAARAVSAIYQEGVIPAAVEMMDRNSIGVVEKSRYKAGYPDCAALLLVECDGYTPQVEEEVRRVRSAFERLGGEVRVPENPAENSRLWLGRKGAFPAMGVVSPAYLTLDSIVPRAELASVLEEVGRIAERRGVMVANVFHAADGNLHPLIPYNPESPQSLENALRAGWEIVEASIRRGGVPSGEHGVGIEKARFMHQYYSQPELEVLWRIKRVFDPDRLLNPYKMLYENPPETGDRVVSLLYTKPWEAE